MYRLDNGIRVMAYEEIKGNICQTLLEVFLDSYNMKLEEKLNLENKIYLEDKL